MEPVALRIQPANRIAFGVTIAVHALALSVLLSHKPTRQALLAAAPVMMELITPRHAERPNPEPATEPPKPRHVVKHVPRPRQPPPPLTTATEATSLVPAPSPPTPVVVAPQSPTPVAQIQAPIAPVIVTQPIYDADYLENPAPNYPALSRRTGEQGRVVLRVLVSPRGTADEVQVFTSSGHPRLDEAARDAVLRWKFVPAKRGSEPVQAWVRIPIPFILN
jgi:protein TonB